jgi:polysaccharide export outer membrane protein
MTTVLGHPGLLPVSLAHRARRTLIAFAAALAALLLPFAASAADPARDYIVGTGDVLRVLVYQSPDLTLEARVSESGSISYPLLGQVRVAGLSVSQVESEITLGLQKGNFLRQPQVTVQVLQVRGNQVSVLGLANRPGRYPIDVVGMRLTEMVALAGGVAPGGSDIVTLSGEREGKPFRTEIDLPALYGRKSRGEDPVLRNGDVVYIDRAPTIYIYGEVQRPGQFRLERDMNVRQALAAGGGLTLRGTEKGLSLERRAEDGGLAVVRPTMADRLQDGDVLYVRESLF